MRGLLIMCVLLLVGCAGAELSAAKTDSMGAKPSVQMSDQSNVNL